MKFCCRAAIFTYLLLLFIGCAKDPNQPQDPSKEIITFSLKRVDGTAFVPADVSVAIQGLSITVTLPYNTDRNGLVPYITISGKTIYPASGVPQNFTVPVVYTVTAQDGSTVRYTVTVLLGPAPPGMVYFGGSDNSFYALNTANGSLVWKYNSNASFVYSSATYSNNTIYVGGIDNYVYAFDPSTGVIHWKKLIATTGIESDAVCVNGIVYVGTNDDCLVALDAQTGNEKWRYQTRGNISASPTVLNGTVYFGSSDNRLYALDALTGSFKWSYATGAMINQSGPALVNGVLYFGSRDAYLYAVDAASGNLRWRFSTNGISLEQSSPTVSNGVVYIGGWYDVPGFTRKGSLYAVNANTGELVWEKLINTGIGSSPCVAEGRVFITTDDLNLYALDQASGNTLWSKRILANGASAAVSNGIVYIGGGGSRYFYALDASTGAEKWKYPLNALTTSSPLIVTGNTADYCGDSGMAN